MATFIVSNLDDSGSNSLRNLINRANADTGPDIINFDLSLNDSTISLVSGSLTVTDELTIDASGLTEGITIEGNNTFGLFEVTRRTFTIDNLTLTGGSASNSGGAIKSNDNVFINNSTISGNSAVYGGGIYSLANTTINNSTISGNSAVYGGGIYSLYDTNVYSSTISGNSADSGGGIFSGDNTNVYNSTISGNSADSGGGIYSVDNTNITNSTISGNSANSGGGIFSYSGENNINNSIIAGNTATNDANIFGTIGQNNNNIIASSANGIMETTLKDNGGDTQTLALLPGSPAINAGDNSLAVDLNGNPLITDQRGVQRFVDTVDIGAFEEQHSPIPIPEPLGLSSVLATLSAIIFFRKLSKSSH